MRVSIERRLQALELRTSLNVEDDLARRLRVWALSEVLTEEELDEVIEDLKNGRATEWFAQREAGIANALDVISMKLTGQPYGSLLCAPRTVLARAARLMAKRLPASEILAQAADFHFT
jgi:hypothetical protein